MPPTGLEAVLIDNRDKLLRFLTARGAGDAAEDLLHDLWLKVSASPRGPIANPLSYLFRAANMLMIDRYRMRQHTERRDRDWIDSEAPPDDPSALPDGEREINARQEIERVATVLAKLGPRRETVFRRARIDGVPQRHIAEELGISLSTVESDLRTACVALAELKDRLR